jgi:hypothetical protein
VQGLQGVVLGYAGDRFHVRDRSKWFLSIFALAKSRFSLFVFNFGVRQGKQQQTLAFMSQTE